ncbi:hypothetical protein [Kribbella deserti]|uniref:Uncharacterized protein n=1 Tax=Kribbella deserti TaxID=1926257 RepID=A0ABV6QIB1_9ACTN
MTLKLPTERPLPRPQTVLDHVLATGNEPVRRRGWLVPVAAAASVAVVAGGVLSVSRGGTPEPMPVEAPVASTSKSTGKTATTGGTAASVRLAIRPLNASERAAAAKACLNDVASNGVLGEVSSAVLTRTWGKYPEKASIAVLDRRSGLVYACTGRLAPGVPFEGSAIGGDPAKAKSGKMALNQPDETHPAVPTDNITEKGSIELDARPDLLARESWYRVDDRVASVRQRILVNGKPGPWYVADAAGGYAHVLVWNQTVVFRKGDKVRLETQVLDRAGRLLDAPADQKGGGGLTPSPGTTRVDNGIVIASPSPWRPANGEIDWQP